MLNKVFGWTLTAALAAIVLPELGLASEGVEAAAVATGGGMKMGLALAAGFGMAIAALGGALGQGRAAGAALEGITRNPESQKNVFVPMILGLVFIESLVLFTFAICFILQGKI